MAPPISMPPPRHDPRIELQRRLEDAPAEHAEALLAGYEVLQGLHDRGALEFLRGLLGSSDKVLEIAVDAAHSPESTRSIRNLILLLNMLGAIDPDDLATVTRSVPPALKAAMKAEESTGISTTVGGFLWNRDVRRALAAFRIFLQEFGSRLLPRSRPS